MRWSAVAVVGLALLSVMYLTLAMFVLRNREVVASRPLVAMLLATKVWTIAYALELTTRTPEAAAFFSGLKYVGIVALPPALWSFVREFTGKGPLSRRTLGLLLIEPVVFLALLVIPATSDKVHTYEQGLKLLGAPTPTAGPLFWPHAVYTYVVMFSAVIALMMTMTRIAHRYRRQGGVLVAASVLPMVGNIAWNVGWLGNIIDPTPALFGITAIVLVWGFFRLRLLDLIPVAREVVLEQMADAVMVIDVYGRIADANPAVRRIFGTRRRDLIGRTAADLLPGLAEVLKERSQLPVGDARRTGLFEAELELPAPADPGSAAPGPGGGVVVPVEDVVTPVGEWLPQVIPAARDADPDRYPGRTPELPELPELPGLTGLPELPELRGPAGFPPEPPELAAAQLFVAAEPRPGVREIAVSLSGVTDALNKEIACIVMLRDVTERNRMDRRLRTLLEQQTRLSDVLRQSLLPASLPEVFGLRMAARYLPAPGGGVGGDFYDVHPTDDGRWAFVLGDVSGKGVHAAVVTSTARHTVRSLSAQGWRPRQVLEQLNRVLVSPDDPERFCTVVYGQVDPPAAAGSGTVHLVLTLGGHPPPLIRRRDGSVVAVGLPGTVLGMLPDVRLDEVSFDLYVGDVLLAYTDGVTEARSGSELLGEEGLAAVLATVPEVHVGMLADTVVSTVEAALAAYTPPRDDVALLALAVTGPVG